MKNTSLCYIEKDGKYLIIHRVKKKNDVNFDKYIGLGGKFLENESPEECVRREVFEESALTLKNLCYRAVITFVCDECEGEYMHLFTSDDFDGDIDYACDEGELEWIDKKELLSKNLWEGDKIFLKLIQNDSPFFSLKLTYKCGALTSAVLNGEEIL